MSNRAHKYSDLACFVPFQIPIFPSIHLHEDISLPFVICHFVSITLSSLTDFILKSLTSMTKQNILNRLRHLSAMFSFIPELWV